MANYILWQQAPQTLALVIGDIHVWRVSLLATEEMLDNYWYLLTNEERERANRFHFLHHRRRFIAARGALRTILGRYIDLRPETIEFDTNSFGKPCLFPASNPSQLQFNLSHSGELAVLGVTLQHELGIDIEHIANERAEEGIAQRFFSVNEYTEFCQVSDADKKQAFYNAWTRKEAFIKAVGQGLSYPLDQFDVSLSPDKPAKLLSIATNPTEAQEWSLYAFLPEPDYIAAIASHQQEGSIHYWDFD